MIRFFRKLFKRGDFMTRADKAYYKYRAKTIFWSAFCLIIISWVGTNLVLCALTTNVKSGGDIIYEVPRKDVYLPTGIELIASIKGGGAHNQTSNSTIKTLTFGYLSDYATVVSGVEAETISTDDEIYLYRLNNGANVYVLSRNNMIANADCSWTFAYLRSLTEINFDNFDASKGNITEMDYMFWRCSAITILDLHDWNTSNVTNMESMFSYCSGLVSVDLSSFDTHNVIHMANMFGNCGSETIDVSSFDTSNVIYFTQMFVHCSKLKTIFVSSKFNITYKATSYTSQMFYLSKKLQGGAGTVYDENHTDGTYARIDGGLSSSTPGYFTAK